MTEIVSLKQIVWGSAAASLAGVIGWVVWRLRRGRDLYGRLWLLLALTLPLWELYELLDDRLDMVTLKGAGAAYLCFIIVGLVLGWRMRHTQEAVLLASAGSAAADAAPASSAPAINVQSSE